MKRIDRSNCLIILCEIENNAYEGSENIINDFIGFLPVRVCSVIKGKI